MFIDGCEYIYVSYKWLDDIGCKYCVCDVLVLVILEYLLYWFEIVDKNDVDIFLNNLFLIVEYMVCFFDYFEV